MHPYGKEAVRNTVAANLERDELLVPYGCCAVYLSLHYSEGVGRGIAAALQLGLDAIATDHSGNTDFCTVPLAHPVRCVDPCADGYRWGEPDLQHAVELHNLGEDAPGDVLYHFDAPKLKAANHRLDGVFWPRSAEAGTAEVPVVLLEVQMLSDPGFQHRLFAQTGRFLQLHPHVQHLAVVVVLPQRRLNIGPAQLPRQLQSFLDGVIWLSLEELRAQGARRLTFPL
jgi:hypothetical protein